MSSTSTNKQPLLIDRPLHKVYNLSKAITGSAAPGEAAATIDITGTNTAIPVVNCIGTDGAIIEDFYLISRSATAYTVNLYFSFQSDFLRTDAVFVGQVATTTAGQAERVSWANAPSTMAPVPQVGSEPTLNALYVPAGTCLWAALQTNAEVVDGPIAGFSGGLY